MATSVASISITDFAGDTKSVPMSFDDSASLADITTIMQAWATQLDDVVDGKIDSIQVNLAIALPAGLKAAAVTGNTVHVGALLNYDADDTQYTYSVFVPSWAEAGFSGKNVVNTGNQATAIATVVSGAVGATADPTDEFGNDITAYVAGTRKFRK